MRGTKQACTVGHHTLLGMIHYHWSFDKSLFTIKRERVQLVTLLIFFGLHWSPSGSILESSTTGIRGSGQAMLYRDLKLKLLQPSEESSLLVLEVTIRLEKGKRTRPSPKMISLMYHFFHSWYSILDGIRTHPSKSLSAVTVHRESKRLGERRVTKC